MAHHAVSLVYLLKQVVAAGAPAFLGGVMVMSRSLHQAVPCHVTVAVVVPV